MKLQNIIHDVLEKQMHCSNEPQVLIFDRECELASLLADAYIQNMPTAEHIDFNASNPDEIREKLLKLPEGATVVLVQSTNFRLAEFRIRLELFNKNIGCLEHSRLAYFAPEEYETYINALEFRGDYYKEIGTKLAHKIESAQEIQIITHGGCTLRFGPMEEVKINHGLFAEQKHRGGAALCGEVFSEARDFKTVNGEVMVRCYPDENLRIVPCTPFKVRIQNSLLTCDDLNCPDDFRKNILDKIAASEDNEVMVREAGFGLNPAISFATPLSDVNNFERMEGFHLSLGKKHNIYRDKIDEKIMQRYHIDVFADLEAIKIDSETVFENGHYILS